MIPRLVLLAIVLFGGVRSRPTSSFSYSTSADLGIMRSASAALAHNSPSRIVQRLRRDREVEWVGIGLDGRTVSVLFRDGLQSAILPAARGKRPSGDPNAPFIRRLNSLETGARALVLEPFASQLGAGGGAGDEGASVLQSAGFTVDRLLDSSVTVQTMATLSQYSIVYMNTHSGVNQYGEGVVATGELFDSDHSLDPLVKEGSLMSVSVAGTSQLYYGVLSQYIRLHEGSFPPGALVMLNGCGMLRASLYWQALQQRGVQTLVGWDNEVLSDDASSASAVFFNTLESGATVDGAVQAVLTSGHGFSTPGGEPTAKFGYLGNGSLTLRSLIPASPTPVPSDTPSPVPSPTVTPAPALVPHVSLARAVGPGTRQTIRVLGVPALAHVSIAVTYPDGDSHSWHRVADATGAVLVRYVQPRGTITHSTRTARVRVVFGPTLLQAHYAVGFGPLDVSLTPPTTPYISHVTLWVHAGSSGVLRVSYTGAAIAATAIDVRRPGWVAVHPVGRPLQRGDVRVVAVHVTLRAARGTYRAGTSFILLS